MNCERSFLGSKKNEYQPFKRRNLTLLILLSVLLLLAVLLSLQAGSYTIPFDQLILGVFGKASDEKINMILYNNRLIRICTALLAGAGLGVSGCIFQAVLRNPLASASTLGVSQGAGFGAAFAVIVLNLSASGLYGGTLISICAFVGSMSVAVLILGLSKYCHISSEGIVLAGVAISSMFTGATSLLQYFADELQLQTLVFWTFGDLSGTTWRDIVFIALIVLITMTYFMIHRWDYNALLSGSETAASVGINVPLLTIINMILCCLCSSVIVSYVGLIQFIGLAAPHIVRMMVGSNHSYLIMGSALMGAILLLMSDWLARSVLSPVILPIGAVTSFLGGPLFLYLLFKGSKKKC